MQALRHRKCFHDAAPVIWLSDLPLHHSLLLDFIGVL